MKKYLLYELKKNIYVIACLTAIATIIYLIPLLTCRLYGGDRLYDDETQLSIISTIGAVLAVAIPVWILSYKMKKRSVDLYYSLPLSRQKVLAVKILTGLVAVFFPYTVAYWLGAFIFLIRVSGGNYLFNFVYYLPLYLTSIPAILCIYAISAFAFTRANSFIDGLVFVVFWNIILCAIACYLFYGPEGKIEVLSYLPFAPLYRLTSFFQIRIIRSSSSLEYTQIYESYEKINMGVGYSLTGLMAIGAGVWLFLSENKLKAENVEQISESWFGYRVMIPLITVLVLGMHNLKDYYEFIPLVLSCAASLLVTILYKRTVKLDKTQWIVYASSIVVGIILSVIS